MRNFLDNLLSTFEKKIEIFQEEENFASIILHDASYIYPLVVEVKKQKFKMLIDICGVDYPASVKRFEVVYQFLNMEENLRFTIKLKIEEGEKPESITSVFRAAGWFERETFDMYGIEFSNTKDLRRILTDYNFQGFPLRKDFPLTGYFELKYDISKDAIVQVPVNLSQKYRVFDFESPWENVQYEIKKN